MKTWVRLENNSEVTEYYLKTIGMAFYNKMDVVYVKNYSDIKSKQNDIIVISEIRDILKTLKFRNVKRILWIQGSIPDESFMRNKSKVRYYILNCIEYFALKKSNFIFFVSEEMKRHYCRKYKMEFDNSYIMACSNEEIHPETFSYPKKYSNNVFCYAGGTMDAWHCFEDTVRLYAKIEKQNIESMILLLVREKDIALKLLKKYGVKNYEIDFVPVSKLNERLSEVKFGLILREPSVVNSVATPTKAMTYMANGVIPIYSECLVGLNEMLDENQYKISLKSNTTIDEIEKFMKKNICSDDVLREYQGVYRKYYDRNHHISEISKNKYIRIISGVGND